jgi:DnaJ homolog subfamily C member 28
MRKRYLDRRAEQEIEAMLQRGELAAATNEGQADQQPAKAGGTAAQRRGGAGEWQGLVEQRILDGMERGLFDNLRGAGQPLDLDADRFVPDELKMAFRLLRSTGLAPLWVELNKEIREDIARLHRYRAHVQARRPDSNPIELYSLRKDYLSRIHMINDKIMSYNILAPSSQVHFGLLIVGEELARFDDTSDDARTGAR